MEGAKPEADVSSDYHHPALVWRYSIIGLLLGFVSGSLIAPLPYVAAAGLVVVGLLFWRLPSRPLIIYSLLGLWLAIFRWSLVPVPPAVDEFIGEQTFVAKIISVPRWRGSSIRYLVRTQDKAGRLVELISRPYPRYAVGDIIQIHCPALKLSALTSQHRRGVWRECAWPQIIFIKVDELSIKTWLYRWRTAAAARLNQSLAEPYAALTTGMLWGDDSNLSKDLLNSFRRSGTSHILAVSGFNVTILVQIIFTFLVGLGLWRRAATAGAIMLISAFIVFSGAEASVIRAGLMGAILLLAKLLGRRSDDLNVLFGTAAAMLLFAPQLIFDLGFQLSFAAMAGLIFIAPLLQAKLRFIPELVGLRELLSQTLSATIVTLPLIMWQVQQLSLVSLLANLLVGPVVLAVFVLGLFILCLSFIATNLAAPLIWALTAILAYVIWVVETLAALPLAVIKPSLLIWPLVILLYLWLLRWLYKNYQPAL